MKIGIIGPIASGKTTFAHILSKKFDLPLVEETVKGNDFLPLFYKEKATFALFSQNFFYGSLFYNLYHMKRSKGYVSDTTVYSNLVFSHLMVDEGILTKEELSSIKILGQKHLDVLGECDLYIVIKRSKQALFRNWKSRNRHIEKDQEDYLDFHYSNYYHKLDQIFRNYHVDSKKIYTIKDVDFMNEIELDSLLKDIRLIKEANL